MAGELAERGIASLRINFRGEGDKLRSQIESTQAMRVANTEAERAWLLNQPGVKAERVGVLGWSLGATKAIFVSANQPTWWRTMAVWSSPSGDQFAQFTSSATAQTALREGVAKEVVPGWKRITTPREFYESFRGVELDLELGKFPGAFLSVRGSGDFLPQHEVEFMKRAKGRPAEALVIGGADHIFNVFQPELGHATQVVAATLAWFERTL